MESSSCGGDVVLQSICFVILSPSSPQVTPFVLFCRSEVNDNMSVAMIYARFVLPDTSVP